MAKATPKLGNRKTDQGYIRPIEDEFALSDYIDFALQGRRVGAALLKKGDVFQLRFVFRCQGIHPTLRSDQMENALDQIEAGLKPTFGRL